MVIAETLGGILCIITIWTADFINISPEHIIPSQEFDKIKQKNDESNYNSQMLDQIKKGFLHLFTEKHS